MSKPFSETEITTAWSHVVPGTLRFESEGHHANKQTVEIRTRDIFGAFDGETRRIATSDLFQCFWTVETKAELDKARRSRNRMVKAGREIPERLASLDDMWKAQVELCSLDHPRITEARAKLAEAAEAEGRREERKASKGKAKAEVSTDAAAEALGVAA